MGAYSSKAVTEQLNAHDLGGALNFHSESWRTIAHATIEHQQAGDQAHAAGLEKVLGEPIDEDVKKIVRAIGTNKAFACGQPPVALSYGDIVKLSGDYYARYDDKDGGYTGAYGEIHRVVQPLDTASDLAETLKLSERHPTRKSEDADAETTKAKLECIVRQHSALKDCEGDGYQASLKWINDKTLAEKRYYLLALGNWDHFHPHCFVRYKGLHGRAVEVARQAGEAWFRSNNQCTLDQVMTVDVVQALAGALKINAFADHFLQDSFSSGHLYGRRKEDFHDSAKRSEIRIEGLFFEPNVKPDDTLALDLQDASGSDLVLVKLGDIAASSWAKHEHDSRGDKGVLVACNTCPEESLRGEQFFAYGDWHLDGIPELDESIILQSLGRKDALMLNRALLASWMDVIRAFMSAKDGSPHVVTYSALDWAIHSVHQPCGCVVPKAPPPKPAPTGPTAVA